MKRTLSILFSLLALIISVHHVLAYHFCGGELTSVEFFVQASDDCCCSGGNKPANQHSIHESDCCRNINIELATDDLMLDKHQVSAYKLFDRYYIIMPSVTGIKVADEKYSLISPAPSEYLFKTGSDMRSHYCVYII